jgi:pyrroline-5-carboxylate reductase
MSVQSVGFVGTGAISEAMVRGLLASPSHAREIHLSPRNAETAGRLGRAFSEVRIADNNQEVIDRSDVVVLAIRPQIARDVIEPLSFKRGQTIISVIAATHRQDLLDWIGSDVELTQAIPLPFVEDRQGVTAIFPPNDRAASLFKVLGTAVLCETRMEYDRLAAASALMSTYFGIMAIATEWLVDNGLEQSKGQAYLAPLFQSLADRAQQSGGHPFSALAREFATLGGLNEQVLRDFEDKGGKSALTQALDGVRARIEGSKPHDSITRPV